MIGRQKSHQPLVPILPNEVISYLDVDTLTRIGERHHVRSHEQEISYYLTPLQPSLSHLRSSWQSGANTPCDLVIDSIHLRYRCTREIP